MKRDILKKYDIFDTFLDEVFKWSAKIISVITGQNWEA